MMNTRPDEISVYGCRVRIAGIGIRDARSSFVIEGLGEGPTVEGVKRVGVGD